MKILVTDGSGMTGKSLKKYLPKATFLSPKDCNLIYEINYIKNKYKHVNL